MKILVTGATGFIGSRISENLVKSGFEVFGVSRLTEISRVAALAKQPSFHLIKCDIADFAKLLALLKEHKFDLIFHTAVHYLEAGPEDPTSYLATNVGGTLNILRAAQIAQTTRIIASSSKSVYGIAKYLPVDEKHPTEPVNFYGMTKLLGDLLCQYYARKYGLKVIILRYSGVFGPGRKGGAINNFFEKAMNNEPPVVFSDSAEPWDTIYVKDAAQANMRALAKVDEIESDIFNIGLGHGVTVLDVANKVIQLTNSQVKAKVANLASTSPFVYDITKAQNILGYQPQPLSQSLEEYVGWTKSQLGLK